MANIDYKNGKLIEIIREFDNTDSRYEINGITQAIAVPFWRKETEKFQVIPKGAYRYIQESGNNYLEILDNTILEQAIQFQICYVYSQISSKYIEDFPELTVLVNKYNELIDDTTKLFSYLKSVGMTSDTLQLTKVMSQLEPLTTWYMDELGEIKALPISDLYGKFNQMIEHLKNKIEELLNANLNDTLLKLIEKLKEETDRLLDLLASSGNNLKPKQVPDIEFLKRVNAKVDEVYEVLGYYKFDDGATHKRIISRNDDGTGIQLNNSLWANILEKNIVYTSWFGTKENEDSTEAVQKALDVLPNTKSTIIVDKPTTVRVINIKPYKSLTGNKLKVEQINLRELSNLTNIEIEANDSLDNKPMILIDSKNTKISKCDILIDKIKVYGKTQNRDFLLVKNVYEKSNGGSGLWGIKISDIWGDIQFNTIIKFQCARLKANPNGSWITYCSIKNIRWYRYKKGIELLTFNVDDSEGEYGYDSGEGLPCLIQSITIDNCTFESTDVSETFCRLGNGCREIYITNSLSGDYIYKDTKKYYIFDTRGKTSQVKNLTLYLLNKNWLINNNYFSFLGDTRDLINTCDINFLDEKTSISTIDFSSKIILNFYSRPGEIYIIAKIPKNIDESTAIPFILSPPQEVNINSLNIQTINLICNVHNSHNPISKVEFSTNINKLKKLIVFKDTEENLYIGLENTEENNLGFITGYIEPYFNQRYFYYNYFLNKQEAINYGFKVVEEIFANNQVHSRVQQLDTIYYLEKMKQDGVYNDYISYMEREVLYDKEQRKLKKDRRLAYEQALKENPYLTFDEFLLMQPMTLNLISVEEPKPSEALKKFMDKYLE